jgi:phenylalanyl-tRNA synthetase alpha subunit
MLLLDLYNILFAEIGEDEETDTDELDTEQGQESGEEEVSEEANYTQRMQSLAEREDEMNDLIQAREDLDYLLSNPRIAQIISEGDEGQPVKQQTKEIDPNTDPTGYLKQLVAETVRSEVSGIIKSELGGLQSTLQPLLQDNYEKQAIQEFEIIRQRYPIQKGVGLNSVLNTLSRHPTLTMEDAFLLNAQKSGTVNTGKKPPILERSSKRTTSTTQESKALADKGKSLRDRAVEQEKQGLGIRALAMKFLKGET